MTPTRVAPSVELLIDGRSIGSTGARCFESIDPATEEILGTVAVACPADVDRAVAAARAAFDTGPWPRLPVSERAATLLLLADLIEERLTDLAELETRDTGLPVMYTAGGHLPRTIAHFRYFAGEAERLVGESYPMDDAYLSVVHREPSGAVAVLTPWNSPLPVASMNIAAALACGNTCVVKPSELAPLSVAQLGTLALEAGLPPGVLNVIHGGPETGQALVAHPGIDVVSFTGGTATGRSVLASAAHTLKRVGSELGGRSATIVFADADFDDALDGVVLSTFASNGEACMAGSRILVEEPVHEAFIDSLVARAGGIRVGDPILLTTEMGPLVSRAHLAKVRRLIEKSQEEGATLACGGAAPEGSSKGFFLAPTVVAGATNQMRISQTEVFGPVATVIPFADEENAVAMANDSSYGLAGYVWSGRIDRAMRVAKRLRVGTVAVNLPMIRDIRAPFGGYKESGIGRVGGRYSIDLFTEVKTTCLPVNPYSLPRLGVTRRGAESDR